VEKKKTPWKIPKTHSGEVVQPGVDWEARRWPAETFQISKMKNFKFKKNEKFQFFRFKFLWHISNFQISKSFFNFFHFLWPFFKIQKRKFSIQISKMFFPKFFISNFPYDINEFFSLPEVGKFNKRLKKLPIYPYQK
jgi:hypothetical protein